MPERKGDPAVRPLHVSLDVSAVPEEPVGAGRYTIELVRALARRGDLHLTLWSRRADAMRWEELLEQAMPAQAVGRTQLAGRTVRAVLAGRTVRAVAPEHRPARLAWEQLSLPRLVAASGAHVHHGPHYTMPARSPVPVVVTIHDLTFFDHPEWHERTKVPVFRHAIRRAARRAAALVCVSNHTARRLQARASVRGRLFVVPHGVDHARFLPAPSPPAAGGPASDAVFLEALGVRRPYVLFLGTLEPRKAVPDLVRAFAVVAGRRPDLTLVLAGRQGWGADEIRRAAAETDMFERVLGCGYVADEAVPALLRRAGAVVYPAHEEGFGLPALEALACGTPLVTTAGTVMAELAGDAAWLAAPGAVGDLAGAMEAALSGGAEVERRRALGLAVAASRTWEHSAEGHVAAYRWAAGARGHRGAVAGDR